MSMKQEKGKIRKTLSFWKNLLTNYGTGEGEADSSNGDQDAFCANQLLCWQINSTTLPSCKFIFSLSIKTLEFLLKTTFKIPCFHLSW